MIGNGGPIRQRERETLSPPLASLPWLIVPLPFAFSGDGESLSSIHAQLAFSSFSFFLFHGHSLSFSLSLPWLPICDLSNQ